MAGPSSRPVPRPGGTGGLPAGAGIGLRAGHVPGLLACPPAVPWLELLADNHLEPRGPGREVEALAGRYPVALHCVSLNLGGAEPLDGAHLARVRRLADRLGALEVSDHLSFTAAGGVHHHDLLPLPWTEESLRHVAGRVARIQDALGRRLLVENVSAYLAFRHSTLTEPELLSALVAATGCGLLVDVNNLYVNQANHGVDPRAWLAAIPPEAVGEAHLAGHEARDGVLVDTHGAPVSPDVWALYHHFARRFPGVPVLVERDNDIPPLGDLLAEARRAQAILDDPEADRAA